MVVPIVVPQRGGAPLLGTVWRGGGVVRWQKQRARTAEFDAMRVDATKVPFQRSSGPLLAGDGATYDRAMRGVVDNMFERDGVSVPMDADAPPEDGADDNFEALRAQHAWQQQIIDDLRAQQPPPPPTEIADAERRERMLVEAMLMHDPTAEQHRPLDSVAHRQHNFTHVLNRVHLCYEKEHAKFLLAMRMPSLVDQIVHPVESSKSHLTGRDRLNTIRQVLDSFGLERSDMQKVFHEDMIGACAKLIFKDDLLSELDDLLLELGVDELQQQFMAITPRRMGKTYSVAMFVVALLFGIEGIEQAIFSTGRRASQKLIELVYRLLCKIPGMRESITKHNVETIWIQGPYGDDDVRKVFSYPSNVRISLLFVCVGVGVARACARDWIWTAEWRLLASRCRRLR